MKKISLLIPAYNEQAVLDKLFARLGNLANDNKKYDFEFLFVNDGSRDKTLQMIKEFAEIDSRVSYVNLSRNFGKEIAMIAGLDHVTGDATVIIDADLQDPPELIPAFYKKWMEGYDVVYGVRTKREAPLLMQIAYKLFYRIFHKMSYITMPLDAGDFSLIDRKVVEILKTFPERDRFLRGLRAWVGYKQTGVPYVRAERMFGKTTNNFFKNFNWATKGIFSFSYVPLQLMTMVSLAVFILSFIGMAVQITLRILYPDLAPKGTTTILIAVLFIGSIQLLGISILGEYIGKIFEEVKQRPKYIVKSILRKKK